MKKVFVFLLFPLCMTVLPSLSLGATEVTSLENLLNRQDSTGETFRNMLTEFQLAAELKSWHDPPMQWKWDALEEVIGWVQEGYPCDPTWFRFGAMPDHDPFQLYQHIVGYECEPGGEWVLVEWTPPEPPYQDQRFWYDPETNN